MSYSPTCRNTTQSGCRCVEHDIGLVRYTRPENVGPLTAAIERINGHASLHVLTPGPPTVSVEDVCAGTMTCVCRRCSKQRAQLIRLAGKRTSRQPWEARPPKQKRRYLNDMEAA